ncbi:MAG: hypothetical protein GC150_17635 [Rhizobiales bacterium]|nr:hypothetical protein [Hyphomicrobiales bacterium]
MMATGLWLLSSIEPSFAFSDCHGALTSLRPFEVEEAASVSAEPIPAREIFGPPPVLADRIAGAAPRLPVPVLAKTLSRRIDGLWRMRLPRSIEPRRLLVRHELSGNEGVALQEAGGATGMNAVIRPLPPRVICRNATDQIVEGDAELVLRFHGAALAGRYHATISTEVRVP